MPARWSLRWLVKASSGPRIQPEGGRGPSTPNGPDGPLRGFESANVGDRLASALRAAPPASGPAEW
eukprot:13688797-Alexandrium_andersonii.AAC.1